MVRRALTEDCTILANLHISGLRTGFLSELDSHLLSMVYRYLIRHQQVWVYEENEGVIGFISLSLNGHGMMKQFIIRNPLFLMRFFVRVLLTPALLIRAFETFRAPVKSSLNSEISGSGLDMPELLSIVVGNKVQAKGIGTALLQALEAYLRYHNYLVYKVVAGEDLVSANKFYKKNGFSLAFCITIHGSARSNVYIKHL